MLSRLIAIASFIIGSGIIIYAEVRWKVYLAEQFHIDEKSPTNDTNPENQIALVPSNEPLFLYDHKKLNEYGFNPGKSVAKAVDLDIIKGLSG